ncbi:MAG: efflux RND transporter permease subunit [Deltaproteobacteria bacterium]|nr:efflux RND transporter permease subunit [Deltaproteobacteria bacterium]
MAVCAGRPGLTVLAVLAAFAVGVASMRATPLDAIPDLSDTQVIVSTEWRSQSPDRIEDQLTYPISARMLATPGVRSVRGLSMFGLSLVYVIFEDGTDLYWARTRVLERLNGLTGRLPEGALPTLGPDATGVGWIFEYALVDRSGQLDLSALRSLQDWTLRYALESVPGVAEVASVGGFVRQYQIEVDPNALIAYGIALEDVVGAVEASNEEAGGGTLEQGDHEYTIRARGSVKTLDDLRGIPLRATASGTPVRLEQVATLQLGPELRRGLAELDGEGEVVGGIVVMRHGENALAVIDSVKTRLAALAPSLPEGVEVVVTYDRSTLIEASIDTLRRTLVEEMLVVSLVIFVFLLHARSALVPILTIPIGVVLAFVPMVAQGLTANIMSLGGIAVAIGAMVDASIILVENVHKRLGDWEAGGGGRGGDGGAGGDGGERSRVVLRAMQEVGPSVFFALLVITVSFLPIFALEAVEGRLFHPLAYTKSYAMGFAAILSVTLTPALAALFVRGRIHREEAHPLQRALGRVYAPIVRRVVRHRVAVVFGAALLLATTVPVALRLGSEFMPPLDEGTILYMPAAPEGISMTEAQAVLQRMDRALAAVPEVARVFGKIGRAETATDPAPLSMVETVIELAPRSRWRPGLTPDALVRELDAKLDFPGFRNLFWMPIQTRTEMLATGFRSPLGLEVFGPDVASIEQASTGLEKLLGALPGTRSAVAERLSGGFFLDIHTDREAAARHGLRIRDVHAVVETAIGGRIVSQVVDGRERYGITVRYARDFREDVEALARIPIATPSGAQVPLGQVARFELAMDRPFVRSEAGQLVGFVTVDAGARAIVDYVADANRAIDAQLTLPTGVRLEWVGQHASFERARARLAWVVPLTLAIVALLLLLNTGSLVETAIVLCAVPFSLIGAFWLLWALDYHLSVGVGVGLIALAGLDAQTGVVMLLYLKLAHAERLAAGRLTNEADLEDAIVEGAARRIRPKLMTVAAMTAGLLPLLLSDGTGADLMKRIAAPMVGGLASSFALELLVYPALFAIWKRRLLAPRSRLSPTGPSGPSGDPR